MSTLIALRTNRFGPDERAAMSVLERTGLPLIVAADGRGDEVDTTPYPGIAMTEASVTALGLPLHKDMGWLCGDYPLALVAEAMPDAEHIWLVEPDMRFHFKDPGTFFSAFAGSEADLIAMRYDLAPPDWYWIARMAPFGQPVRRMLFAGIRMSRRAIAAVVEARRRLPAGLSPYGMPNDEAIVATTLGNGGYECRTYADFGRFVTSQSFGFAKPISGRLFDMTEPDELVYHPVVYGEAYLRKARAFVRRYPSADHIAQMREGVALELGDGAATAFATESEAYLEGASGQ